MPLESDAIVISRLASTRSSLRRRKTQGSRIEWGAEFKGAPLVASMMERMLNFQEQQEFVGLAKADAAEKDFVDRVRKQLATPNAKIETLTESESDCVIDIYLSSSFFASSALD